MLALTIPTVLAAGLPDLALASVACPLAASPEGASDVSVELAGPQFIDSHEPRNRAAAAAMLEIRMGKVFMGIADSWVGDPMGVGMRG